MQAPLSWRNEIKYHDLASKAIDLNIHPGIGSVSQLDSDFRKKLYFSGSLIQHVVRKSDGSSPEDARWTDMWGQLCGVTLSLWDSEEIEAASGRGEEVHPTDINIINAVVEVYGSVTTPATATTPARNFPQVIALNTAGSNFLLFSCPSSAELVSWVSAIRLAAWEKSRLEEIYTGHLLRSASFISHRMWKDPLSPLERGRMEGWVHIRLAGHVEWKRVWLVVQGVICNACGHSPAVGRSKPPTPTASLSLTTMPFVAFYASSEPKDTKRAMLTFTELTQAFAVYRENPEMIPRSSLIKLEGTIGEEDFAGGMKGRDGWVLIMVGLGSNPEEQKTGPALKWLTGIHDAFCMYGRPNRYEWNPRNPESFFFAYPFGQHRDVSCSIAYL
ncbi:hypothetical protein BD410DRAFT_721136 [Rickenella mellea]|uniref:PH domain-containing protein n=1 Tax=Rickenella mellea TaxID=50990 RepID=A0A4Y7Q887_9AGAM|nr:hypothetical protein BD410DRAFT_721136 [Rickenella mellea]